MTARVLVVDVGTAHRRDDVEILGRQLGFQKLDVREDVVDD